MPTSVYKLKKSGFAAPGGCPFALAGPAAALKGDPAGVVGHPFTVSGCPAAVKVRSGGAIKPPTFSINAYYQ